MKKVLVGCTVACALLLAPAAQASLVINGDWATGDETGWTRWQAPWGNSQTWSVVDCDCGDPPEEPVFP